MDAMAASDGSRCIASAVRLRIHVLAFCSRFECQKGASVIRMLYNDIDHEDFRKGLENFVAKFAYMNASPQHLWSLLEESCGYIPIAEQMSYWTTQKGFPLLRVDTYKENRNYTAHLTLTQNKFSA